MFAMDACPFRLPLDALRYQSVGFDSDDQRGPNTAGQDVEGEVAVIVRTDVAIFLSARQLVE